MVENNYTRNAGYGAGRSGRPSSPKRELPKIAFYGADGKVSGDLVDSTALKCAECFVRPYVSDDEKEEKKDQIKTSQLRKFYADVKSLEMAWTAGRNGGSEERFSAVLPQVKLLKAKASYALGRKVVPDTFKTWLCTCIDQVRGIEDFRAFLLHFEAVVGFAYGLGLKD